MTNHASRIKAILRVEGSVLSGELAKLLSISQPTLSRALTSIDGLIRLGKGRRSRCALVREIGAYGHHWPVYRVSPNGKAETFGNLIALEQGEFALIAATTELKNDTIFYDEFRDGLFPGLPWFLEDVRPQGFLGRAFTQKRSDLKLGNNPENWNSDEALIALLNYGADTPGNWIVGEVAMEAFQESVLHPRTIPTEERELHYARIVEEISMGIELPGSSAGGEQPKFAVTLENTEGTAVPVLVKFSGPLNNPNGRRWADLLHLESLAAAVLFQAHIPAAQPKCLEIDNRCFLEVERFDRIGHHGRLGMISLRSLVSAHIGELNMPWNLMANKLLHDGWIDTEGAEQMQLLHWFGVLIGNTDMHAGNFSFELSTKRPLNPTPSYDMLPMYYAPTRTGDMNNKALKIKPPLPDDIENWNKAAELAEHYWNQASHHESISDAMRGTCLQNLTEIRRIRRLF